MNVVEKKSGQRERHKSARPSSQLEPNYMKTGFYDDMAMLGEDDEMHALIGSENTFNPTQHVHKDENSDQITAEGGSYNLIKKRKDPEFKCTIMENQIFLER